MACGLGGSTDAAGGFGGVACDLGGTTGTAGGFGEVAGICGFGGVAGVTISFGGASVEEASGFLTAAASLMGEGVLAFTVKSVTGLCTAYWRSQPNVQRSA